MKTLNLASLFNGLSVCYQPLLASGDIGNSGGHCPNYDSPLFDFSIPEDLFQEDNHTPEFYDSLLGDNLILGGNEWSLRHQTKFSEPKEDLLSMFYENYFAPQHCGYDEHHELDFIGTHGFDISFNTIGVKNQE